MGKLALKYEAAGKVRVFAIVDSWTQAILAPLHEYQATLLSRLPGDATFDQLGSFESFCEQYTGSPMYSFDLTAATDSIPLGLYRALFTPVWGEQITTCWLRLLTARRYYLPSIKSEGSQVLVNERPFVKYGTGQPIGARSSWPSIALVHHFIVFISARRAGLNTSIDNRFEGYRVLGDDITIANTAVAEQYRRLCIELGIPINEYKSVLSPEKGVANFANKVIMMGGVDISPFSLKEELSITTISQR